MILALDCGRTTGWARSDGICGSIALNHADYAAAFHTWMLWLSDQCSEQRLEMILIERPFIASRLRNGDFTPILVGIAHTIAYVHNVPRRELAAVSVRKAVFGRGTDITDKMRVHYAQEHGWRATTDHEADAVLLLMAWQAKELAA